jgi:hypothetical protein
VGQEVRLLGFEEFDAIRVCPSERGDIVGHLKGLKGGPHLLEFTVCSHHRFLAKVAV